MMTDDQRSAHAPQEARGVAPGQRAYLFVGERPSPRAAAMEVCWEDDWLCAATLFRALEAAGIDPLQQQWVNLWQTPGLGRTAEEARLDPVRQAQAIGREVVALGRLVQGALRRAGIPYTPLIHPAARSRIRGTALYHAHVRVVLAGSHPPRPCLADGEETDSASRGQCGCPLDGSHTQRRAVSAPEEEATAAAGPVPTGHQAFF